MRRRRALRPVKDERGVVLVWSALMLVLLIGSAAYAIDVALWHVEQSREQRASDAAALAGAVTFPGNGAKSNATALDIARQNGYPASSVSPFGPDGSCALVGSATIRICTGQGDLPNQFKVAVVRKVNNLLGGIFGIGTTAVKATGTAEYLPPLVMGSPSNQYGNDPDAPETALSYPNFWGNIAGGVTGKSFGDAYAANTCDGATDGCSTSGYAQNLDFKPQGYFYSVTAASAGPVDLQAFDPGFVYVGDLCNDASTNLLGASNLPAVPNYPQGADPADWHKRYLPVTTGVQSDPGLQYCTGDTVIGTGSLPTTTYTVLKASVPGDPSSATQVCAPITYPGFRGDLAAALGPPGLTVPGAPAPLATYFRQWVTLCTVNAQEGDNYFIQMTTDASAGHNRFALRAVVPNSNTPADVNVAGNSYMGIYANAGARNTEFYLARVPTAAAGHTLVLNFFDIGDASSPGTLQVAPPSDSNAGSTFSGCRWTGAPGKAFNSTVGPWGPFGDLLNCMITGINVPNNTNWQGQWITVTIPMPANYKCSDDDPKGCWVKINYNFSGSVTDTTSWNAYLIGDPVRLVK